MEHDPRPDYPAAGHNAHDETDPALVPQPFALVCPSGEHEDSRATRPSTEPYEVIARGLTFAGHAVVSRYDPGIGPDTPRLFLSPEHARDMLSHRLGELTLVWL